MMQNLSIVVMKIICIILLIEYMYVTHTNAQNEPNPICRNYLLPSFYVNICLRQHCAQINKVAKFSILELGAMSIALVLFEHLTN